VQFRNSSLVVESSLDVLEFSSFSTVLSYRPTFASVIDVQTHLRSCRIKSIIFNFNVPYNSQILLPSTNLNGWFIFEGWWFFRISQCMASSVLHSCWFKFMAEGRRGSLWSLFRGHAFLISCQVNSVTQLTSSILDGS
jgi:hypothetical protein